MPLLKRESELSELMQAFQALTDFRIMLYDEAFQRVFPAPSGMETVCSCLRKASAFDQKCRECDLQAIQTARHKKRLHIYKCHAGFTEAVTPIVDGGRIIGYMMMGQIADRSDSSCLPANIKALFDEYSITADVDAMIKRIKYRSNEEIVAAARILEACACYTQLKEYVYTSGEALMDELLRFVNEHLAEDLSIKRLCARFRISRTRLYTVIGQHTSSGIAAWIRHLRLERAKQLLHTTDLPVSAIAEQVGFSDYNYFLRVFKKTYGVSSGTVRNSK